MIEITIDTRKAVATNKELLTTGSAGIGVQFSLSADWDDLIRVAVFRNGEDENSQIDVALTDDNACALPVENCGEQYVGEAVYAGVYGTDETGAIIIPTVWVSLGALRQGVKPGNAEGAEPTPDMWAQLQAIAMNAGKENADAAELSATNAAASAEAAAGSATAASASADAAAQSALQAADSALGASGSASSAEAAQAGAEAAQTAAEAAQTAAETAQGLAEDAQTAAEAAATSAIAAKTAAETAKSRAETAKNQAVTAKQEAVMAQDSASFSEAAAELAQSRAEAAQSAAETAQSLAETAQSGAETAQAAAETAQESAEAAQTAAETAAESIEESAAQIDQNTEDITTINSALTSLSAVTEIIDTASGAIASFPDGSGLPMRSLLAQIEPLQDLHGYDAPWAGGSGKNLFDQDTCTTGKYIGETGNIADWTTAEYSDYIAVTAGQQYIFSGTNKTGAQGSTRIHGYNSSKVWVQQITTESVVADAKWNTTFTVPEGISFVRVSTGYPLQDGQLEKGSTATEWTPYSNICPISGWTGLSGERDGANLWDEQWENGDISSTTGQNEGNASLIRTVGYIPVDASKSYYFFCGSQTTGSPRARFYDKNKGYIGYTTASGQMVSLDASFTPPTGACYMRFAMQATYGNTYLNDISVNYPATVTTYHAYTSLPITCTWQTEAGTVYGGNVDVVTGVLTVTDAIYNPTGSEGGYTQQTGRVAFAVPREYRGGEVVDRPCSDFSIIAGGTAYCYVTTDMTVEELKAYFQSHTVQMVLPLTDTQTYQLTPQQISTLIGNNTVFVDCGSVSVTYQASIKGYIDKVLAS